MSGLIGWWPLHETEGDTAYDLSGNDNHGAVNGPSQGVVGRAGLTSYFFDGDSDYVDVPTTLEDVASCVMWVYIGSSWESSDRMIGDGGSNEFDIRILEDDGNIEFDWRSGAHSETLREGTFSDGKWYQVGMAAGEEVVIAYLNGEVVGIVEGDGLPEISGLHIGNLPGYDRYWNGQICDVRIYDRMITPGEVRELYRQGSRDFHKKSLSDGSDVGAVSRWKLDDGGADGSTAVDSWGGNDGSIEGAAFTDNSVRNEGQAIQFDGSSDGVINSQSGVQFDENDDLTFSAWIKPDSMSDYASIICGDSDTGDDNDGINLRRDGAAGAYELMVDGDPDLKDSSKMLTLPENGDAWHHLVGIYDSDGKIRLFHNGSLAYEVNNSGFTATFDSFKIGRYTVDDGSTVFRFDGAISDVRVYNRVLESWEVFELYRWGSLGKDMRKELVNKKGNGGDT